MAFNATETARAARIIQHWIDERGASSGPITVRDVALLTFPGPVGTAVSDLILGFFLECGSQRHWLTFALKPPWTAVHWGEPRDFRNIDEPARAWTQAFGHALPWEKFRGLILDQRLKSVTARPHDRVLDLRLADDLQLTVELFSARPNWVLAQRGVEQARWRESRGALTSSPNSQKVFVDAHGAATDGDWFLRQRERAMEERRASAALRSQTNALRATRQELKDNVKLLQRMEQSWEEACNAASCRVDGDELKAHLHEMKGKTRADATEKMTKLYARAKKLERTAVDLKPRLQILRDGISKLRATGAALEAVDLKAPLEEVLAAVARIQPPAPTAAKTTKRQRPAEKKAQAQGLRRFTSHDGLIMWVGRNHAENEEIVMKLARGNDLWFHLKGRPGAHVIVQVPAKKTAPLETLLDAATLAAHYSGVKDGEKAEVDYAQRKNVKRRPGGGADRAGQFLVNYTGAKTLMVKIQPERLKRLMTSETPE